MWWSIRSSKERPAHIDSGSLDPIQKMIVKEAWNCFRCAETLCPDFSIILKSPNLEAMYARLACRRYQPNLASLELLPSSESALS